MKSTVAGQSGVYYPQVTPLSAILRYAGGIVERFHPEKIILFGSYAYGTPTADSDVDLLVVMPTRHQVEQAVRIDEALEERGFPLDLLVRTPKALANLLRSGDSFMKEIITRGKVLYEKDHPAMGAQGRKRHRRGSPSLQLKPLPCDEICFHCQQAIEEKYFKGLLAEQSLPIQKTHDLTILLKQLIPTDGTLGSLGRGLKGTSRYAVEYRYPGLNTTSRQARAAYQKALAVRGEIRNRLGLPAKRIK